MKKKSPLTDSIDLVQKKHLEDCSEEKLKNRSHNYKKDEAAPIPTEIDQISPHRKKEKIQHLENSRVSIKDASKHPNKVLQNRPEQKSPLFIIELLEAFQKRNIKNIKVKQRLIPLRKIREFSQERQVGLFIQLEKEIEQIGDDAFSPKEFVSRTEERHFRIDRIIKYLSKP